MRRPIVNVLTQPVQVVGCRDPIVRLLSATDWVSNGEAMVTKLRGLGRCVAFGVVVLTVAGVTSASAAVVQPHVTQSWQTNGRVTSMKIVGNTAYIGGKFTSVRPAGAAPGSGEVVRNHAAAINVATGALLPWNPNANGVVQAITANGKTVYLGGSFTQVGGKAHPRLAAVNPTTGVVNASWKPTADAQVMTLTLNSGILYAGGQFTTVNTASHPYLAALVATTGAIAPSFKGTADAAVTASTMTADRTKLVIGGDFTHVSGSSQNHIAATQPGVRSAACMGRPHVLRHRRPGRRRKRHLCRRSRRRRDVRRVQSGVRQAQLAGRHRRQHSGDHGGRAAIVYAGGHYGNYCGPQGGTPHLSRADQAPQAGRGGRAHRRAAAVGAERQQRAGCL